ncbi:MAG: DNA-binding domain-containing protein, partial [Caulobacter sp.]|nr:DNA-binding domain-containing protein [Caulobacter sp.]
MARIEIAPQAWFSAAELAEKALPGLPATKRGVQMLADREGWARRADDEGRPLARTRKGRGGGTEYHLSLLSGAAQARLAADAMPRARAERPDRDSMWMRHDRAPDGMKAEARRRLAVIDEIERFVQAGLGKEKALTTVVAQARRVAQAQGVEPPYGESTVRGWFSLIAGVDPADRLAYLVPGYVGRTRRVDCTREAFDLFASDYLRLSCPTYEGAYQRVLRAAAEHGWVVPSAKSLKRRLDAEFPQNVQLLCRKGPEALAHAYPHMDRSRAGIGALQIVNLDGHTWDNLALWPDGTKS